MASATLLRVARACGPQLMTPQPQQPQQQQQALALSLIDDLAALTAGLQPQQVRGSLSPSYPPSFRLTASRDRDIRVFKDHLL